MTPSPGLSCSLQRAVRFHLGTVAFGSLIIALLRMVRVVLEKIEAKLAKYHQVQEMKMLIINPFHGTIMIVAILAQDNILVKAALCACKSCFWCLEKFMKFLNRSNLTML